MTREQKLITISHILNNKKVFQTMTKHLGIKLNNDSPSFGEIEEFILEKLEEQLNH